MNKSDKKIQLDIAKKLLDAMRDINVNNITVEFLTRMRQYNAKIPSEITIFDDSNNNFCIYLYADTDINQIVQDMTTKNYIELEEKYSQV